MDFPNQLRAINVCHTQWSRQHPGKAITDAPLVACMKAQGFRFDPNRQIKGVGPCHGNKTATNHPDCYAEPPKTRASRIHPTVGAARVPGYPLRAGGALTDETVAVRTPVKWRHAINIPCRLPLRLPDIFVGQRTDPRVMLPFGGITWYCHPPTSKRTVAGSRGDLPPTWPHEPT